MLTEKERILLLMYRGFGDRVRSYQEVADLFNATHPDCNPISKLQTDLVAEDQNPQKMMI